MFKTSSKKIDLSFIKYLGDDDLDPGYITIEQIKRRHPSIAKSNLECFKMFLMLNHNNLNENEKQEIKKTIDYLYEREEEKYKSAIMYIDKCQNPQKSTHE